MEGQRNRLYNFPNG